jgi:ABC-type nickel/cobalt efflux system permease component RcnA
MAPGILAVLAVGGLLGFRHAFEPDHLAAVSTLATRQGRLWAAARLGLVWGAGHTATVGAVALAVLALGLRVPPGLWPAAELLVAVLLVLLGATIVWRYARGRWHMHMHAHPAAGPHFHLHSHANDSGHAHPHPHPHPPAGADARRSLGFGVAHGLAGSGAIAVLLVAAAPSAAQRVAYFAALSAGTMVGMLAVSLSLAALVRLASGRGTQWATALHVGSAVGSVAAGLALASRVVSHLLMGATPSI